MKRLIIGIFVCLLLIVAGVALGEKITGDVITGKVVSTSAVLKVGASSFTNIKLNGIIYKLKASYAGTSQAGVTIQDSAGMGEYFSIKIGENKPSTKFPVSIQVTKISGKTIKYVYVRISTADNFCSDSDGGLNYEQMGLVTYYINGASVYRSNDVCSDTFPGTVIEVVCLPNGSAGKSILYLCPNGCLNGACNKPSCIPQTCSQLGKACGDIGDECGGIVNCGVCSIGKICSNGNCYSSASGTFVSGINYNKVLNSKNYTLSVNGTSASSWGTGTVTVSIFYTNLSLIDYITLNSGESKNFTKLPISVKATSLGYKTSDNVKTFYSVYLEFDEISCPAGMVWGSGGCVAETLCKDSDGGINYTKYGTIYINGVYSKSDICINKNFLNETFCSGSVSSSIIYNCSIEGKFCNSGFCVPQSCSDSDGGLNYYNNGTVSGISKIGETYYKEDYCSTSSFLNETFCSGVTPSSILYNCSLVGKTCSMSKCI